MRNFNLKSISVVMFAITFLIGGFFIYNFNTKVFAAGESGTSADVLTLDDLNIALANVNITTINIKNDITGIASSVIVNRAVTINGENHKLAFTGLDTIIGSVDDGLTIQAPATINDLVVDAGLTNTTTWVGTYAIHVYNTTATLNGVTATKGNGGILVNGSNVTLAGTTTVSDNGFGGIEISKGLDTGLSNSTLTVSNPLVNLVNSTETYKLPTLWLVDGQGTISVSGLTSSSIIVSGQTQYYLKAENASKTSTVITLDDLNKALADVNVGTIIFANNITTDAQISIQRSVTINGNNNSLIKDSAKDLTSADGSIKHTLQVSGNNGVNVSINNLTIDAANKSHGVLVYGGAILNLDTVTIKNSSGSGLNVNGATVSANNLIATDNLWGAVNVDPGFGVTTPSIFTLTGNNNNLVVSGQQLQIWSDGSHVNGNATATVNANGYTAYKINANGYKIWSNTEPLNVATITNNGVTTVYSSLSEAINAAAAGDTINLLDGEYDLSTQLNIEKNISIVGSGSVIIKAANASWGTSNDTKHLLNIDVGTKLNPVTLSNITLDSNGQAYGLSTYNNAYAILKNVTIKNSIGAGLTVNGSTITTDGLKTSGNGWGSVNIDPGSGVTTSSVFTLKNGTLSEDNKIWSDGKNVGNSSTVTVNAPGYAKVAVSGAQNSYVWVKDDIAPIGGSLTMATKLHPNGITVSSQGNEIYVITPALSITGVDVFQSLSVTVSDDHLDTTSVPVSIDGTPNGEMVYNIDTNVWNYANQVGIPTFEAGTHTLTATFKDTAENETKLTAKFVTDNTSPTATAVSPINDSEKTITYTFSEPVQLVKQSDGSIKAFDGSVLGIYAIDNNGTYGPDKVFGINITNANLSDNILTIKYSGSLIKTTDTTYVVDAWGYNIEDLAGNKIAKNQQEQVFTVTKDDIAPIGGSLRMKTKLHPNGINVEHPDNQGIYVITPALSITGTDVFNSLSVIVKDDDINVADVPVYIDTNPIANGSMVYDSTAGVWNYANQVGIPTFATGTHTLTATFKDNAGNTTTLTAQFVTDNTSPIITLNDDPSKDIEIKGEYKDAGATATDNVDTNVAVVTSSNTVDTSKVGTYTVIYTATDAAGNVAIATRTVNVVDTTKPTIEAPVNLTKEATGTLTKVSLGTPTVTDNSEEVIVATNDAPVIGFHIGDTTVTWTATDASGNSSTATQIVTITDKTIPVISGLLDFTKEAAGTLTKVSLGTPTVTDNSEEVIVATNDAPVIGFHIGDTTVTWTAKDSHNNIGTFKQKVTIIDTIAPVISKTPTNITAEATSINGAVVIYNLPTAGDLVSENVKVVCTPESSSTFGLGTTTVNCSAKDAKGNESTSSFTVTVTDTTVPVITLDKAVVSLFVGDSYTDAGAIVTDNVDVTKTIEGISTVDTSKAGTYIVTYNVNDAAGNHAAQVIRTVIVNINPINKNVILLTQNNVDGTRFATIPTSTDLSVTGTGITASVNIPAGTVITGPTGWDGTMNLPNIINTTVNPIADGGKNISNVSSIEMGFGDTHLTLNQPVKITFAGQANSLVGWSQGGVFHNITNICDSITNPTLLPDSECKITSGSDLIVWTRHFTTFTSYTQTTNSNNSGGGSIVRNTNAAIPATKIEGCLPGNLFNTQTGKSCTISAVPAKGQVLGASTSPVGKVLGAQSFNFTLSIKKGSKGTEVTELQKFLTTGGYLTGTADGIFGAKTKAAVIKFQVTNNLKGDGAVGALTRAILNK